MKISYYTIDNLRLGRGGKIRPDWLLSQMPVLEDALEHYRSLPAEGIKTLGITNGIQAVELVRCLPLSQDSGTGEDVLLLDFLCCPLWKDEPAVMEAARTLTTELNIRYCLDGDRVVPAPENEKLPHTLADKYLWRDRKDEPDSAIHWAYLAGVGWISPAELKRRYPVPGLDLCYPLVLKYRADGVTEQGSFVPLEVTPWEYKQLAHRTQMRIDQNKKAGGKNT